ncbi:hypothetical protein RDABS01_002475 [Bienertia sinuspersici]
MYSESRPYQRSSLSLPSSQERFKVGLDSNVYVSNALMDVYAKCGKIEDSLVLFEVSTNKNDVAWNTRIVGYCQSEDAEKALLMFKSMLDNNLASGCLLSLVSNSLIDINAKCGNIKPARLVFDTMDRWDEVSWNTIISAYAMHGLGKEALILFQRMQKTDNKSNKLTFAGVLSARSDMGLLDEGQALFSSMVKDHGIEPCVEHYTCMVWLLGRLRNLDKAMKLITDMPVAAEHVLEMEPQDETAYVLLSNIYASVKQWGHVALVQKSMNKGVKKEPGLSWVEIQEKEKLQFANCNVVLLDVEDEEKERLCGLIVKD